MAKRGVITAALRALTSRGAGGSLGRSLLGGSRAWSWIVVAGWGLRGARRVASRRADVYRIDLRPGETFEIDHLTELHGDADGKRRKKR